MFGAQLSIDEAVEYLTMQRDKLDSAKKMGIVGSFQTNPGVLKVMEILEETGDTIGYAPAFRCLVKGLTPEQAIRWGR